MVGSKNVWLMSSDGFSMKRPHQPLGTPKSGLSKQNIALFFIVVQKQRPFLSAPLLQNESKNNVLN